MNLKDRVHQIYLEVFLFQKFHEQQIFESDKQVIFR